MELTKKNQSKPPLEANRTGELQGLEGLPANRYDREEVEAILVEVKRARDTGGELAETRVKNLLNENIGMAEEVFIKARDWWRETGIFDRVKMNPKDIAESRRLQQKSFQIFPVNKSNVPIKQASKFI